MENLYGIIIFIFNRVFFGKGILWHKEIFRFRFRIQSEYDVDESSERKISNVTAAKNSVKPKFCSSCGRVLGDKSWRDGYCESCGTKL